MKGYLKCMDEQLNDAMYMNGEIEQMKWMEEYILNAIG